jgi:glycosyltransferase involved in cell wall biosynthesis
MELGNSDLPAPHISIVIPVYNEEEIVEVSVRELVATLEGWEIEWELLLCENGSRDRTPEITKMLSEEDPRIHSLHVGEPNYGLAMRYGIENSRGEIVVCDEIDICDCSFYREAVAALDNDDADMVIGSKALATSADQRPVFRRTATLVLNFLLRVFLDFRGTDTHGLKAFRRERLLAAVAKCVVDRDLFASEFVIRSQRMGLRVIEIPVSIEEKRPPSVKLLQRVPHVLKSLGRLVWVIRIKNR